MARRPRTFVPGLFYHVVARGNHRQAIFLEDGDYRAYLVRLAHYQDRHEARVHAYCLMPNHVHVLIRTGRTPLSRLMQGLQQSYTQYFNRRHATVGHLFQGRYNAFPCADDPYLLTLVDYIHANPVRAGLVPSPEQYRYSSHRAYARGCPTRLVDPRFVLGILSGAPASTTGAPPPPASSPPRPASLPAPDRAVVELARRLRVDPGAMSAVNRTREASAARAVIAFTLVRGFGYQVRDVADAMGLNATSVSVILHRMTLRLHVEPAIAAAVTRLSAVRFV
jgi:putative transposase